VKQNPISKITRAKMAKGVAPAVEQLPRMWKFKSLYWSSNSLKKKRFVVFNVMPGTAQSITLLHHKSGWLQNYH
jgi:hypothetical protein